MSFEKLQKKQEETIKEFYGRLRTLAKHCESYNSEFEIKMQIVYQLGTLRKRALKDPNYPLTEML